MSEAEELHRLNSPSVGDMLDAFRIRASVHDDGALTAAQPLGDAAHH